MPASLYGRPPPAALSALAGFTSETPLLNSVDQSRMWLACTSSADSVWVAELWSALSMLLVAVLGVPASPPDSCDTTLDRAAEIAASADVVASVTSAWVSS